MDLMQLAEVAGVSKETVRRVAKSLYPDRMRKGVKAFFTDSECKKIIEKVRKKNMVSFNENLPAERPKQETQVVEAQTQNVEVIAQAVAMAMQTVMMPMMEKLLNNQKALPEPIKEDFYSLVAYSRLKGMTIARSELALHGSKLRKIATSKGIELKKIPDERWGFVNSYPVHILDEYFAA